MLENKYIGNNSDNSDIFNLKLDQSWLDVIGKEFEQPYMHKLEKLLLDQINQKIPIAPEVENIFKALQITPFDQVKVLLLGQDPYFSAGQAHGLSFSVPDNIAIPSSLKNIFKELENDLNIKNTHGNLEKWAQQGVLLLNSVLTVQISYKESHSNQGWEQFTDKIVQALNQKNTPVVFLLWGKYAQQKAKFITNSSHLILKTSHPSGLSCYRGFLGSKPFSQTNSFFIQNNLSTINWKN